MHVIMIFTLKQMVKLCYAKSLQSSPTLCDPIDGSPPGSPVPGMLQARTLEWVAISFSNAWKWKVKVKSLSRVQLLATPWTAAYQAPPSMGFSRQEYWNGVPLPSPNCKTNPPQTIRQSSYDFSFHSYFLSSYEPRSSLRPWLTWRMIRIKRLSVFYICMEETIACVCVWESRRKEKTNDGKKGKTIQNRNWLFWTQSFLALLSTAHHLVTPCWVTRGTGESPAFYSLSGFSKQLLLGDHPTSSKGFLYGKLRFHFWVLAFIHPLTVNVGFIYPFWI